MTTPAPLSIIEAIAAPVSTRQANTDDRLIELWLHGRSPRTQRAYRADAERLFSFLDGVPLRAATLGDLQAFADWLAHLAPASQGRALASVKSLYKFAHTLGYITLNPAVALRLPKLKTKLAERILSYEQVITMIALESSPRNRVLLRLLYASGARVSELVALCWRDAQERGQSEGQVTLFGKGDKTRAVLLSKETWAELQTLRPDPADPAAPIFTSRESDADGRALDQSQVNRIVKAAAVRAGLPSSVSPHWLRHSHASHAIDRNAPISLVQATLGHASIATTGKYLHARPDDSSARYLGV